MKKPIIQGLWIGDELSLIEHLCIASFLHHGHEFHLYTYTNVANIPTGTIQKDANDIIPEKDIFVYSCNDSYAGFADWFRWTLLYDKGHFWVDMDVICLKPFIFDTDIIYGMQDKACVGSAIAGFPPQHDFCQFFASACSQPNKILPYDTFKVILKKMRRKFLPRKWFKSKQRYYKVFWGEYGPDGVSRALKYFKLFDLAKPKTYFYPVSWRNWRSVYDGTLEKDKVLLSDAYAIHLWNEQSREEKGFDKNATFAENSLIEYLKAKYLT